MSNDAVNVRLDGRWVQTSANHTVLAMLINAGVRALQAPGLNQPRFALCGMGVCQDCAVEIDGQPGQLACLRYCRDGMQVRSG